MRTYLVLAALIFLSYKGFTQTAVAKLKFEDAEQSYNNGDYKAALNSLNDAEKLFGKTNPPIQHLQILSQAKLIEGKDLFMDTSALQLFYSLYKGCESFLQKNGNDERLTEKYKEIYQISEQLKANSSLDRLLFINELKQKPTGKNLYQLFVIYTDLDCDEIGDAYMNQSVAKGYLPARIVAMRLAKDSAKSRSLLAQSYKPLMKLVDEGDPYAARQAALVYDSDSMLSVAFDPSVTSTDARMRKYFLLNEKAAEKGEFNAMAYIAYLYESGDKRFDISADPAKSQSLYVKAMEKGNVWAAEKLGGLYAEKKEYQKALLYLQKGVAMGGKQMIFFTLANMYQYGTGVEKDYSEALKYNKMNVARGNTTAYANIGNLYYYGGAKLEGNYTTALEWYRKGAEKNDAYSMSCIARMYGTGSGVAKNLSEMEKWTTKAAKAGRVADMMTLAENYIATPPDVTFNTYFCYKLDKENYDSYRMYCNSNDSLSAYWYMEAAKNGNKNAKAQVGMFYLAGLHGLKEEENTAMEYFKASGDSLAYSRACFLIGLLPRLYKTPERSIYLLTKAAERGHYWSMVNLADRYKKGYNGYPKDKDKARYWEQKYKAIH